MLCLKLGGCLVSVSNNRHAELGRQSLLKLRLLFEVPQSLELITKGQPYSPYVGLLTHRCVSF